MPTNKQLRESITQQLVEAMQKGLLPWRRPWRRSPNTGRPMNVASNNAYRGINPLLLGLHSARYRFESRWFGTYRQWEALGCKVRKRPGNVDAGEWGCRIVFYKPCSRTVLKDAEETTHDFMLMKTFVVFNADQVEGAQKYQVHDSAGTPVSATCEAVDELLARSEAKLEIRGSRACYVPAIDTIMMPPKHLFSPHSAWYSTVLHELSHWAERRVQRQCISDDSYAYGELVAELSSTFLCQELKVPQEESLDNHAAYLQHWLKHMENDSSFIFKASQLASRISDYLLGFVQDTTAPERLVA